MIVDVTFPVVGKTLPAEHGYALFSAFCYQVAGFHAPERKHESWGLLTTPGELTGDGGLILDETARVGLRVPIGRMADVMQLAGQEFTIDGHVIQLGSPTVEKLAPAPALASRLVLIQGAYEPEGLAQEVGRQMSRLGIRGDIQIGPQRFFRMGGQITDVGHAVRIMNLSDVDSLTLMEKGIGGRRHFGCGVFRHSLRPLGKPDPRRKATPRPRRCYVPDAAREVS